MPTFFEAHTRVLELGQYRSLFDGRKAPAEFENNRLSTRPIRRSNFREKLQRWLWLLWCRREDSPPMVNCGWDF